MVFTLLMVIYNVGANLPKLPIMQCLVDTSLDSAICFDQTLSQELINRTSVFCQCDSTVKTEKDADLNLQALNIPDDLVRTDATKSSGRPGIRDP